MRWIVGNAEAVGGKSSGFRIFYYVQVREIPYLLLKGNEH